MATMVPTAFDGLTVGTTGDYGALFEADGEYGVSVTIGQMTRRGTFPIVTGHVRNALAYQLFIFRPSDSTVTVAEFNATVKETFDPARNRDGVRYLVGAGDDGSTILRLGCYVQSLTPRAGGMTHDTTPHDRQDITPEEIRAAIVAGMAEFARQVGVTLVLDDKQIAESTARQFARHTRLTSLILDSVI